MQHPDYIELPQISPVEAREPLPLYPGNSNESQSSASAINSPPEYQGRDPVPDKFAAAVAQLATSREPIAPIHANIKETMQRGDPLAPEFHIASAATAITYPTRYKFVGGSGGGGGGGGGDGGGREGDPDPDQPMNNNDPGDDAPDPPAAAGGQPAYNPDEHPHSLCGSPPNVFNRTRDKVVSCLGGERVGEGSTTPAKHTGVGSWIVGSSAVVLQGVDCGDPSGVIMSSALRVRDAGRE
jgi:hypothetical protein